jgi:hypothetical protein
MSSQTFEQARIHQLLSTYSPDAPPRLLLDFGDYLSLIWRLDRSAEHAGKSRYYRHCTRALGDGLGLQNRSVYRLVEYTAPGELYRQMPNAPYRGTNRLVDAQDRKAAIAQLIQLRDDVMRVGTSQETWGKSWPGSGITDPEVRERVFAVLFTALQGQFTNFSRLLLVTDIVLANLLLGFEPQREASLQQLVDQYGYPDPIDNRVRQEFYSDR